VWIAPLVRWNPSENLEAICDFIRSTDPDLVCMQEVRVKRGWVDGEERCVGVGVQVPCLPTEMMRRRGGEARHGYVCP